MERGDLVIVRGFVLSVTDGIATVAFPGGQVVRIAADALEAASGGPDGVAADAAAYAGALHDRFLEILRAGE